jgi:ubiquinone/menaquinone biosynthesis C-methylase UbiE
VKGRESGMPQKEMWETFFDPKALLKTMGIDNRVQDVVEFGCGYGTFTIPAAQLIRGTVYAIDIEKEMIEQAANEAAVRGLHNIKTLLRDFMLEGTGLSNDSVDYVMLFNILHIERPEIMLNESFRILRHNGKLGIIHWNHDPATPRGPSMNIRPTPEMCIQWAKKAGFVKQELHDLKPYHYGIVLKKGDSK